MLGPLCICRACWGDATQPRSHDTKVNQPCILAPHVNMLIFTTNITHCYTLALPHVITFTWHFNCHLFNSVLPNNPCCSVLIESPTHMLSISSYLMFFFLPSLSSFEEERQCNFNVRCVSCLFVFYQRGFYILLCEILHFCCVNVFTINGEHLQSASEMVKEACNTQ